jgi:hypothetical protein
MLGQFRTDFYPLNSIFFFYEAYNSKFFVLAAPNFGGTLWSKFQIQSAPKLDHRNRLFCVIHVTYLSKIRNSGRNAYLRKINGETTDITHPCHPFFKQSVDILHYRFKSKNQSMLVEFPDGTTQSIPISWTDRGTPGVHDVSILRNIRLSPFALLELTEWIKKHDDTRKKY